MTDNQTLADFLAIVRDTHPLERQPMLEFQVTVLSGNRFVLWDARPDADEGIASAVTAQVGRVLASAVQPMVGVLAAARDAGAAAGMLRGQYAVAIGFQPDDGEPPPF